MTSTALSIELLTIARPSADSSSDGVDKLSIIPSQGLEGSADGSGHKRPASAGRNRGSDRCFPSYGVKGRKPERITARAPKKGESLVCPYMFDANGRLLRC